LGVERIRITSLGDARVADYAGVREKQLAEEFRERGGRAEPGVGARAGDEAAPYGKFMAEGELVIRRLIGSEFPVLSVLGTRTRLDGLGAELTRLPAGAAVYEVEAELLEGLVGFNLHRGLMAIGARRKPRSVGEVLGMVEGAGGVGGAGSVGGRTILILEDLSNHDNIGACFRNAAAFGVGGVLLSPGCADPLYRKATRVAVGYTLTVPFARVERWPEGLEAVRAAGYTVAALTLGPGSEPVRTFAARVRGSGGSVSGAARAGAARVALMVGAEGPGLSAGAVSRSDARVVIPMAAGVDSLNVAVASAVALENVVGAGCGGCGG
jgi:tRNA G18 (ribose-2'-O)-methylase SpoU